jgi:hypothetical protein
MQASSSASFRGCLEIDWPAPEAQAFIQADVYVQGHAQMRGQRALLDKSVGPSGVARV